MEHEIKYIKAQTLYIYNFSRNIKTSDKELRAKNYFTSNNRVKMSNYGITQM